MSRRASEPTGACLDRVNLEKKKSLAPSYSAFVWVHMMCKTKKPGVGYKEMPKSDLVDVSIAVMTVLSAAFLPCKSKHQLSNRLARKSSMRNTSNKVLADFSKPRCYQSVDEHRSSLLFVRSTIFTLNFSINNSC